MPKWIFSTKRQRSKEYDTEPVDLKKEKEKALDKSAGSGACSSSDSAYSMSPVGSSSSDPDPGDPTPELDYLQPAGCSGPVHVSSTSEDSGEQPLDLSVKNRRGRRRGEGFSRASEDLESSPVGILRRLEMKALCFALRGASGHDSPSSPVQHIPNQIKQHGHDDNLRFRQHEHFYQQQQHPESVDQHPFKGSSVDPRSKGKTLTTARKRHLSTTEGDDESHVTEALVTPEAVARLERIENKIGGYDCKLCDIGYSNAFELANHNCSGIVKVEHRCPECSKVFQCPANLASHRRWHGLRISNRETLWAPGAPPSESKELST